MWLLYILVGVTMAFNPLIPSNSQGQNFNEVNKLMQDVRNEKKVKVIKDETGTPVVILDKNGLRTTQPSGGIDVTTAEDGSFTFNSSLNVIEYEEDLTPYLLPSVTPLFDLTIPHNLNYTPAVTGSWLVSPDDTRRILPYNRYSTDGTIGGTVPALSVSVSAVDDTNITITFAVMDTAGLSLLLTNYLAKFKLYCQQESAVSTD